MSLTFTADASCLRCGGELELLTMGRVVAQSEARAVYQCRDCRRTNVFAVYQRVVAMPQEIQRIDAAARSKQRKRLEAVG